MTKSSIAFRSLLAASLLIATGAAQTPTPTPAPKKPAAPATKKSSAATTKSGSTAGKPMTLTTQKQKASYAVGMNMANGLRRANIDLDSAALAQGLKDALAGKTLLTDEEARAALTQLQNELMAKQKAEAAAAEEARKAIGEANKKEGEAFLAANKTKEGVKTLPSGLQYKVLTEGTGPKPSATDTVVCNYRGTFINGNEFDSSAKSGKPAEFQLNGVIRGWTEALQLMPVGSKWQLFIPSNLAYGEPGRGPIPPNTTLVFEVELLSIQPPKAGSGPNTPPSPTPEKAPPPDKSSNSTPEKAPPPTQSTAPTPEKAPPPKD